MHPDVTTPIEDREHVNAMIDALDRLDGTGPEFGGFLSNHGPMAADALSRLGAPDRVAIWVDAYLGRLEPAPSAGRWVNRDSWRHQLGDTRLLGHWTSFFEREVRQDGWQEVLGTWWPRLLPGAAAGGGHGLIRTAHAVRNLHEMPIEDELLTDELARGLAYWAARYQPLPGAPTLAGERSARDAIAKMPRLTPDVLSAGPGLIGRLAALVALRELPDALDEWGADDLRDSLDELASASARLLAHRLDQSIAFCHAVTAPAAVQMVFDVLPSELHRETVAATWQVVGSLVAAFGFPAAPDELDDVDDVDDVDDESPETLAAAAIDHDDEHVLKLTEASLRQYEWTHDKALLVAAQRFRESVPR